MDKHALRANFKIFYLEESYLTIGYLNHSYLKKFLSRCWKGGGTSSDIILKIEWKIDKQGKTVNFRPVGPNSNVVRFGIKFYVDWYINRPPWELKSG